MDASAPKTTLAEDLRAVMKSRRELWLVYLVTILEYVGVYSFLVTLPLWLSNDFGMNDKDAGWWAATFSMLLTLFVFIVGSIADSLGVRRTLILSFALAAATRLGMSLATTRAAAIVALLAFAFAFATTGPVLQTSVHLAATKRTRQFGFSLWYVSLNVGGVISGLLVGKIRRSFLDPATQKIVPHVVDLPVIGPRSMTAYGAVLGMGFVTAVLAAIVVMFVRKNFEQRQEQDGEPPPPKVHPLKALRDVLGDKAFWRFLVLLALLSLVRMMFQHMHLTWPKYVLRMEGDAFPYTEVWALNSFLILGFAPLGTAITRNLKPFNVLLFGATISALSPLVLCFGSSMPFQITMIVILTIGEALWSPRLYEYNLSIAPRGREATYVSLAALPYFLAKFLVGPSSGYLLDAFCPAEGARQPALLWGCIAAMTLVGPLGVFLLRGWLAKPAEAAPAAV